MSEFHQAANIVSINPALAQVMLNANYRFNRPVDTRTVARFASALRDGSFIDGSTIRLVEDAHGIKTLTDGQHRLRAIVETGITAKLCVVTLCGNPAMDAANCDSLGRMRTPSDALAIVNPRIRETLNSQAHSRSFGAACKLIYNNFVASNNRPSAADLSKTADEYISSMETLIEWLGAANDLPGRCGILKTGVLAVALVTIAQAPADISKGFWLQVLMDDGLRRNDPRRAILDFLHAHKGQGGGVAITRHITAAALCWNAFCGGQEIKQLKFNAALPKIRYTTFPK